MNPRITPVVRRVTDCERRAAFHLECLEGSQLSQWARDGMGRPSVDLCISRYPIRLVEVPAELAVDAWHAPTLTVAVRDVPGTVLQVLAAGGLVEVTFLDPQDAGAPTLTVIDPAGFRWALGGPALTPFPGTS